MAAAGAEQREVSADLDLVIIGAGASGVGCGFLAKKFGIDPSRTLIVERGSSVGSTFDKWPVEMRFITPSFNQQAFGMMDMNSVAFDTSPAQMFQLEHPTGQEYAKYLRVVAHMHELPVVVETDVTAVTPISQCHDDHGQGRGEQDNNGFEVSVTQSPEATRKLPPNIRAKFVIFAAGEFQYPRIDGFHGASDCVHNSRIRSFAELAKSSDEMVVIGGYESGMDAVVHLANAGCNVTVLASTPFWSTKSLDPSTELAPFTVGRLQAAMDGAHPPTLMSHCRVVSVEKDEQDGGYVVTAVKNHKVLNEETLSLQVRRPSAGFGVFLETSTVVAVGKVHDGGAADQAGVQVHDVVVEIAGVQVDGRVPHGLVEAMECVEELSVKGQEVFEWKLRRARQGAPTTDDSQAEDPATLRVKTGARPVLATGFKSGVGKIVNHLFEWTEEALCSSGKEEKVSDQLHDVGNDSSERQLVAGTCVEITGLKGAAEHNGKRAAILSFDAEKGRFSVQLEDSSRKMLVKRANLRELISRSVLAGLGPSDIAPQGDAKLTKCDESTICPGLFLCGPQVRQDDKIFCFVYKYRQRFAVVINEIATRLGLDTEKAVAECRRQHMFLDDPSCCEATCGTGSC